MSGEKKDLTGVQEYAEKLETSGESPFPIPPPLEPSHSEQISLERFESMDDYIQENSAAPPAEPAQASEGNGPDLNSFDFSINDHSGPSLSLSFGNESDSPGDASAQDDFSPADAPPSFELQDSAPHTESSLPSLEHEAKTQIPSPAVPPASGQAFTRLKDYAENAPVGTPAVQASVPFSVMITGRLTPEEREKLLDLISREKMGIRDVDLEPQFAAERVLIPRISEFAAVLIVQALRATQAELRLGPSDRIFSTADTRASERDSGFPGAAQSEIYSEASLHPAEDVILTSLSQLPDYPHFTVIDVVTASASLTSRAVEVESSSEYREILDALQRELRFKAFRKGASAVLNFTLTLTQLSSPTQYRLTVMGSAIRASAPRIPSFEAGVIQ
jgi:hypothetical protein